MEIELKKLSENDLELMRKWRNSEAVASHMFSSKIITAEQQQEWFKKIKNDSKQVRWVVYLNGKPVGSMYLTDIDYINKRCESGWFIGEKENVPFTLPIALQCNSFDYIFNELGLNRVYGYVIGNNLGLLRLLKMCGLVVEGVMKEHAFKNGVFSDVYIVGLTKTDWLAKKEKIKYERIIIDNE